VETEYKSDFPWTVPALLQCGSSLAVRLFFNGKPALPMLVLA
jgi:hypothetical protein